MAEESFAFNADEVPDLGESTDDIYPVQRFQTSNESSPRSTFDDAEKISHDDQVLVSSDPNLSTNMGILTTVDKSLLNIDTNSSSVDIESNRLDSLQPSIDGSSLSSPNIKDLSEQDQGLIVSQSNIVANDSNDNLESSSSSIQEQQEEAKKEKLEKFLIRPQDDGWIMGEDWEVELPITMTINKVKQYIESCKGISEHRQLFRIKNTGKIIPKIREGWSIRQVGISPGSIIFVEPSFKGAWLWNNMEYYINKLLDEVCLQIDTAGGLILLSKLVQIVVVPPPIRLNLHVFLRKYPERIRLITETFGSDKIWVEQAQTSKRLLLPFYLNETYGLGAKFDLKVPDFNFAEYADIDGSQRIELVIEPLRVTYHFTVLAADNLYSNDAFQKAYIYCILWWNNKKIGITTTKLKKFDSCSFFEKRFKIEVLAETNISNCSLYIQLFEVDFNGVEHIFGGVEFTGMKLKQLLCGGKSVRSNEEIKVNNLSHNQHTISNTGVNPGSESAHLLLDRPTKEAIIGGTSRDRVLLNPNQGSIFVDTLRQSRLSSSHMTPSPSLQIRLHPPKPIAQSSISDKSSKMRVGLGLLSKSSNIPQRNDVPTAFSQHNPPNGLDNENSTDHMKPEAEDGQSQSLNVLDRTISMPTYPESFGMLRVKGGLDGYEVCALSARDITKGDHFVVILWVDIDVGHSAVVFDSVSPEWSPDDVFLLKVPMSLSMEECVLEIQLWSTKHKEPDRRGNFNGAVRLTGADLKHFLTGSYPWATRLERPLVTTPSLPKNAQQEQNIQGFLTIIGGASGLLEKEADKYSIQILQGSGFGRKVFCIVYWNKNVLDRTVVSGDRGNPHWEDQKFVITAPHGADLSISSILRIEVYETGFKGTGDFIGCIILEKLDVCKLICASYAIICEYPLQRDPEMEDTKQRNVRGTLTLRGGAFGARCIDERTIAICACMDLALLNNTPPSSFCIVILNGIQVAKTDIIHSNANPVWSNALVHINTGSISAPSSLLEVQVWNTGSTIYLGGVTLNGTDLTRFLGSTPDDIILPLVTHSSMKAKQSVEGRIQIGTPGATFATPCQADTDLEEKATEAVNALDMEGTTDSE